MSKKIFYNGEIMTLEKEGEYVDAVLVEDGFIKAIGSVAALKETANDAELMDLEGKVMMPSFIDPHSHFASIGMSSKTCDLVNANNFDDIVNTMKAYIEENNIPEGAVVSGTNYDHNFLAEQKSPTKDVLDRISTKHMITISHASGHMGVVNSLVIEKLGLTKDSEFGQGGLYCKDEATGELNGIMEENAFFAARGLQKMPSPEQMMELILEGQKVYIQNGITTVQNGGCVPMQMAALAKLAMDDRFTLDVVNYMMILNTTPADMEKYKMFHKKYVNHLKIGGYKLFLDGSPQCKTAWMSKPYEGETEYCGYPILTDEQALVQVQRAVDDDFQLLTHCNGDQASEQLVSAYTKAVDTNNNKANLRPVMIHSQTVRKDQLERMKEIGMMPSIFVAHTYYWGDIHVQNMGEERGNNISPARTALDLGHIINFHQDSPVLKPNMIETIWAAVNRISRRGKVIGAHQRVSVYEALRACTYGGAYEYFEEDIKGTIAVGKMADFVVLDKNPLKVDKMDIKNIKVLKTIKEGNVIYESDDN